MSAADPAESARARNRSPLLQPAVALMNRLTYPRKFLLISVFFLANLTVVMYFLVHELGDRIDFTVKEIEGTRYLRPLVKLFLHAGEARRLARVWQRGDVATRPELVRKLAEVDEDFKGVDAVDRALGVSLGTTAKLSTLKENWNFLRKETFDPAGHGDKLYEDFIGEVRAFYSYVGDVSNLILDPDLDTYYLMDSILLKLHEGQALLQQLGIESEQYAYRKIMSPEERAQFIVLLGLIRSNIESSRKNVEVCFNNNPAGSARPRLEKPYDTFVQATRAVLDGFQRDLVDVKSAPLVAPAAAGSAAAGVLSMSADLWTRAAAELDELMGARVAMYEGRRRIAWIATLLVLGLVAYLWFAFYAAVMGTVQNLEHASQRMLGSAPSQEIVLETHDELGRVARSFNAIAERLRREWEQATQDNARARAAEAGLIESEERTHQIIQGAIDGVIVIDVEGRVVEWNPQASAIFGWTRQETAGKLLSELIIPQQYREAHTAGMRRFRET
ncbi:MAG TPA: PAS domain-containing protein, partial [Planctomycetota bacterium]|nr:PAS domain-containing protein [Planctomycetota bacterium]